MLVQAQTYIQYIWKGKVVPSKLVKHIPRGQTLVIKKAGTIIVRTK